MIRGLVVAAIWAAAVAAGLAVTWHHVFGIVAAVLAALAAASRARGDRRLVVQAAPSVLPFYARAGFVATGALHTEAGVDHVEMSRLP